MKNVLIKKVQIVILLFLQLSLVGQNNSFVNKVHYQILNPNSVSSLLYEKALTHTQLDHLRYLNSRRQIPIEGSSISIELFSAKELLEMYGKPISPLTAKKQAADQFVKFKMSSNHYKLLTTGDNPLGGQKTSNKNKITSHITITNFGGAIFDLGGQVNNYSNNEIAQTTIYSDNGQSPYLNFTYFSTENHFDILYIYDGADANAKLIGSYTGGNRPPRIVQASGAYLTLIFTSDGSKNRQGYIAVVNRGTPPNLPAPLSTIATCSTSSAFCADQNGGVATFPASTDGSGSIGQGPDAETGPDASASYGCLFSAPNPAWYYLKVSTTGPIVMQVAGTAGYDVDFVCWGPFTSPTGACDAGLTGDCNADHDCSGNIVDCSYSSNATETCSIPNAVVGQYYIMLITNYENQPQDITLNQTNTGGGATDCNILCSTTASNTGSYCAGQTINLSAVTTNTTPTTFSWAGPEGFSSTLPNPTIPNSTLAMGGTYSVTATTEGTVTCVATTSVTVSTAAPPTVASTSICAGGTGTLTATGTATSYTWSTGATTATITDNPITNTVYTVTGSVGTCTSTTTATITVVPNPVITVSSGTICTGQNVTLLASGATNYSWTPATGLSSTNTNSVSASPANSTTYTIIGTIGACSSAPVTATVNVISAAVPIVSSNTPCVTEQALNLTCNPAGLIYNWTGPNFFASTVQTPSITATSVTAATAGIYTVTVLDPVTSCTNVATVSVTVHSLPFITATSEAICIGQTATLTANGASAYSWTNGGSAASVTPVIPGNTSVVAASPTVSQSYVIIGTDGNGCINVGSSSVTVHSLPIVTVNSTTICLLATGTLTANGALNYSWSPVTTDLSTNVGNTVLVTPSAVATTIYTVTGQDINGCIDTAIAKVWVNNLPVVSIMPTVTKGCVPQSATYTANILNASAYSWDFGNGLTSSATSPTTVFSTANTFLVKLTLTDSNQCKNTATASVVTYPIPIPDFNYSPKPITILEPKVTFLNETYGVNVVGYAWDFGDDVIGDSSNLKDPVHTYANVGTYPVTLIATSSNGCKDTIVKDVIIAQDYVLYVPNAFSPNGDGKNEIFKPEGEGIVDFKMYIFDRWGNKIFTTDNIDVGWDGRYNNKGGESLQEDVYVWKIDLRNASHQGKSYSGTVILLK